MTKTEIVSGHGAGQRAVELPQHSPDNQSVTLQMLDRVLAAALNPDIDVEKMKAMLEISRDLSRDQAKIAFDQAMARLMPKIPVIEKDGSVKHNIDKNDPSKGQKEVFKFASFENIMVIVNPLLAEEGLYFSFDSQPRAGDGGGFLVTAILTHREGHSKSLQIQGPLDTGPGRTNLQAIKSTISFLKRNLVIMHLNIVEKGKDDDGVTGSMRLIAEDQIALIKKMMTDNKVNEEEFLIYMEASKIENILVEDFIKAVNALRVKEKQRAAQS